jgi:hypothetical protein
MKLDAWCGAIKQIKVQAAHQNFPRGVQRCAVCIHFRPPNDCEAIERLVPQLRAEVPGDERG